MSTGLAGAADRAGWAASAAAAPEVEKNFLRFM